jgi:hypothetical protein
LRLNVFRPTLASNESQYEPQACVADVASSSYISKYDRVLRAKGNFTGADLA